MNEDNENNPEPAETRAMACAPGSNVAIVANRPCDLVNLAGGMIVSRPELRWTLVALSGGEDRGQTSRFYRMLSSLRATGNMGTLSFIIGTGRATGLKVQEAILEVLPRVPYSLLLTHDPLAELGGYEVWADIGRATLALWRSWKIFADRLFSMVPAPDSNRMLSGTTVYAYRPDPEAAARKSGLLAMITGESPAEQQTTPDASAEFFRSWTRELTEKEGSAAGVAPAGSIFPEGGNAAPVH